MGYLATDLLFYINIPDLAKRSRLVYSYSAFADTMVAINSWSSFHCQYVHRYLPTLVIVMYCFLNNRQWMRELRLWAPDIDAVLYLGHEAARKAIRHVI